MDLLPARELIATVLPLLYHIISHRKP